jgi:hypothetical protein
LTQLERQPQQKNGRQSKKKIRMGDNLKKIKWKTSNKWKTTSIKMDDHFKKNGRPPQKK